MTLTQVKTVTLLFTNIILGVAILTFAVGFFPHKASLPGLAAWSEEELAVRGKSPFDKVIFMVVDALRSDFVYGNSSNFHFMQSLIRSGDAVPFTGHASPPTITMPRVKAITTGSVPSFVDLVLNFAESDTSSTLATQDSWLAQMKAKPDSKLIMFGDDTWLRLFPNFFTRADGTTSFFVSDFTEVDVNVTRHLPEELANDDWSVMVMHYLGLDHIGHKTGPKGPNMPAKQREMDDIVKQIYEAMNQQTHLQSCLLVVLGDHGMNEAGNHGANSAGEVSTALTFVSPKFKSSFEGLPSPIRDAVDYRFYDEVEQSDLAPTLAALLGFPIPKNSLGGIIPKLLELWTSERDRLDMLYANAEQIIKVATATYPESFADPQLASCGSEQVRADADMLACRWHKLTQFYVLSSNNEKSNMNIQEVASLLKSAQSLLSGTASKYDLGKMYLGTALTASVVFLNAIITGPSLLRAGVPGLVLLGVIVSYCVTMFASSYVEEEHQYWYWVTSAWLLYLAWKSMRFETKAGHATRLGSAWVCLLFGVMRRWNQTGQKYAGEPDLVSRVLAPSPWLLWTLILASYLLLAYRLRQRLDEVGFRQVAILPVLVSISGLLFKLAFTAADAPELLQGMDVLKPILSFAVRYPLLSLARVLFLGLANLAVAALYYEKPWIGRQHRARFFETFHDILSIFLITQTRTVNVPLFLIFYVQTELLRHGRSLSSFELVTTSLLFQYSSFFAFGGTNAISSVDLSNAYNGIGGYNVIAVGVLTFVSNWTGPIWWASSANCVLGRDVQSTRSFVGIFGALSLVTSCSTLAVMVACTVLREHLFIWTVFSPKFLYMMAWTFGQHIIVNGIFSSIA